MVEQYASNYVINTINSFFIWPVDVAKDYIIPTEYEPRDDEPTPVRFSDILSQLYVTSPWSGSIVAICSVPSWMAQLLASS